MEKKIGNIVVAVFFIVLVLTSVLVYYYFKTSAPTPTPTPAPIPVREIGLTGVIKMGFEVPEKSSYCLTEAYLVTETEAIQIRVPDDSTLSPNEYFAQYKNKKVEVSGKTTDLTGGCLETQKDCSCDAFVLVNNIKLQ